MKYFTILFLVLAVTCAASGSPSSDHALVRHRRQLEVFSNTRKLIEELVANLSKASEQARDAIETFRAGLLEQAAKCRANFEANLQTLRTRVEDAIMSVTDKFTASGSAVRECVTSQRSEADAMFKRAVEQTMSCADDRIHEGNELINGLTGVADEVREFAIEAFEEMRNCTQQNTGNILTAGSCLGSVAVRSELRGTVLLMQSGISIARVNLFMATLPAALEVCAGQSLVGAGMGTARIVMEIGSCSASSVFNTLSGSDSSNIATPQQLIIAPADQA